MTARSAKDAARRSITRDDVMTMEAYAAVRRERRRAASDIKKNRRIDVGPFATFYFESYDTMWIQIHEMLFIERGGDEQIAGEIEAYDPLIPKGRELVATLMLEIDDAARRTRTLARLGGIEDSVTLTLDGEVIAGQPGDDAGRTTEEGKASAVHFMRFPFTDGQVAKFRDPSVKAVLGIAHANYGHMAAIPDAVRAALADDFD